MWPSLLLISSLCLVGSAFGTWAKGAAYPKSSWPGALAETLMMGPPKQSHLPDRLWTIGSLLYCFAMAVSRQWLQARGSRHVHAARQSSAGECRDVLHGVRAAQARLAGPNGVRLRARLRHPRRCPWAARPR